MSEENSLKWVEYTMISDEAAAAGERVVVEFPLSIKVNGKHYATAMMTPMMKREFVIGYLFGQGVIDGIDSVESVSFENGVAEVTVSGTADKKEEYSRIHSDFQVSRDDIFEGVNAVLQSKLYAETQAIHSAGLFRRGAEPVCIAEDIGRHNALDKVIGYALINNIDLGNTFAASTGRMVFEMVSKICRANIPVVATKTAVSNLGIEIAEKCGLTVIGFVRDKGTRVNTDTDIRIVIEKEMRVYTNPGRIL